VGELFLGTEALASGAVTRQMLRTRYRMVHRNIYAPTNLELTPRDRALAAWLWSGRQATLAGLSAAAVLGSRWIPGQAPAELAKTRKPAPRGIVVHIGEIADDELTVIDAMSCTTPARTGYDLGRRLPFETAVIRIDALLNATSTPVTDVSAIAERYAGARGIRRLRTALAVADAGAESPQETRLRLLLTHSGLPRPVTQIPVADQWGRVRRRIDMGYPQWMVGIEYDGEQHWTDARQYEEDIERLEFLAARGWTIVRVSRNQLRFRQPEIVARVRNALYANGYPSPR
jgi:very-short-patch-repair endonuclease